MILDGRGETEHKYVNYHARSASFYTVTPIYYTEKINIFSIVLKCTGCYRGGANGAEVIPWEKLDRVCVIFLFVGGIVFKMREDLSCTENFYSTFSMYFSNEESGPVPLYHLSRCTLYIK